MINEDKILILCSRLKQDDTTWGELEKILSGEINWDLVIERALLHRVSPYLYKWLIESHRENICVPEMYKKALKERYEVTQKENKEKETFIYELYKEINRSDITPILIKGSSLLFSIYYNVEREARDIDIIVREAELRELCDLLTKIGFIQGNYYSESDEIVPVDNEKLNIYLSQKPNHTWPYYRKSQMLKNYAVAVEPHTSLLYKNFKYQISSYDIINNSRRHNTEQCQVYIPSVEYELLIACMNAFNDYSSLENMKKHQDIRLRTYCDIRELLIKVINDNEITKFINLAMKYKCEFPVWQIINICEEIYDEYILPDNIRSILEKDEYKFYKYAIHDFNNFKSGKFIGLWDVNFNTNFSNNKRYEYALDKLFCNCINTHYSCVRNFNQEGAFIKLIEEKEA